MSIFKDKVSKIFSRPGSGVILQAIAASVDLGYYIGKLEIRYGIKSQKLADLRRENFALKARIAELEKLVPPSQAVETIELNGSTIHKTKSAGPIDTARRETEQETLARYRQTRESRGETPSPNADSRGGVAEP